MPDAPRYSDEELLRIVGEERKNSIGFGEGDSGELTVSREKALAYAKGVMSDVPSLPGRSSVVDTAIADAIETVMPDLMEVLFGGEDVATFIPLGEQDEEKAQEETDFVLHVVNTENEGFLNAYTAVKDALLTRTGVLYWWWEDEESMETLGEGLALDQAAVHMMAEPNAEMAEGEDGSMSLSVKRLHGKLKIKAFPSEDFTVASDTVSLRDATYCAVRDRPRVQDLIARGIDADLARDLPSYAHRNETVDQERDRAGEHDRNQDGSSGDLRTVEVRAHYIRLLGEDNELEIWCVITDSEERVLLHKEPAGQIPFAALTPYIVPHRFYGESVADKLFEVQKIKTVLQRMLLDSGYFALNQRMEVAEGGSNEFTIADLLANEPGRPVRVKTAGTVTPISAGALNFDVFNAMEYVATMAESRTGIVRNAQGLNPDTLHDTAKGAMALLSAAQKRVRMIARILVETGFKDQYLGVHRMLRERHTAEHKPASFKRGNNWSEVKPNEWAERCAMSVRVGVGSAGRDHDMMIATQRLELAERVAMLPGAMGTLIDPSNIHNALSAWERAGGVKTPDLYWTDPKGEAAQQAAQANAQKPDPETAKMQAEMQLKQQMAQSDVQLQQAKAQADAQLASDKHQMDAQTTAAKAEQDHALALARLDAEMQLKREQIGAELQLKREQLTAELELKRELGMAQAAVAHETGMAKVNASTSQVEPGGEPG